VNHKNNIAIKLADEPLTRKAYKHVVNTVMVDRAEPQELHIDLSGIDTMTLKELSDLIFYMNYAQAHGVRLLLIYVSNILNQFFALTRTDSFFIIGSVNLSGGESDV